MTLPMRNFKYRARKNGRELTAYERKYYKCEMMGQIVGYEPQQIKCPKFPDRLHYLALFENREAAANKVLLFFWEIPGLTSMCGCEERMWFALGEELPPLVEPPPEVQPLETEELF